MEHDVDLSELQGPEAVEAQALIACMISAQPERRISALQVSRLSISFAGVRRTQLLSCRFIATLFFGARACACSSYARFLIIWSGMIFMRVVCEAYHESIHITAFYQQRV